MYLLDTNIVSELRRPKPDGAVLAWINACDEDALFISAVTLGEIQRGIERTRTQNAAKADEIEVWANALASSQTILTADAPIYRQAARLLHGRAESLYEDALIAATAQIHRLQLVSRNVKDFELLGVTAFNPFE
jgi:toxin FitB